MNDKDREAFENWFNAPSAMNRNDKNDDDYALLSAKLSYKAWQAALDYARKEQKELLEKCEEALRSCGWMRESDYSCVGGYVQTWHDHKITSEALAALHAAGIGEKARESGIPKTPKQSGLVDCKFNEEFYL